MAVPLLEGVEPDVGPANGRDLVRLLGRDFGAGVSVRFGDAQAEVLGVHEAGSISIADVRTPAHLEGTVAVRLQNLDADGRPIAGEVTTLASAYSYQRPRLATESALTRLVRTLLRMLKRDFAVNTSMRVSVDYADERHVDGMRVIPLATLPALVLTPLRLPMNHMYGTRELRERVVAGPDGPEVVRHRPSFTADVVFRLTGSSDRVVELLNLLQAVGTFLNRTPWLEMDRDLERPELGAVRWEMGIAGDFRTQLGGPDELAVFTVDVLVRGVELDSGQPMARGRRVVEQAATSESLRYREPPR